MLCDKCKTGNLQIRFSKKSMKSFVGCSNYPNCKAVYSLPPGMIKKTDKISEKNLPILIALRKGKRPWEFEFNPNWRAENPNYKKENQEKTEE
jgi:DNA topoisomerase I